MHTNNSFFISLSSSSLFCCAMKKREIRNKISLFKEGNVFSFIFLWTICDSWHYVDSEDFRKVWIILLISSHFIFWSSYESEFHVLVSKLERRFLRLSHRFLTSFFIERERTSRKVLKWDEFFLILSNLFYDKFYNIFDTFFSNVVVPFFFSFNSFSLECLKPFRVHKIHEPKGNEKLFPSLLTISPMATSNTNRIE